MAGTVKVERIAKRSKEITWTELKTGDFFEVEGAEGLRQKIDSGRYINQNNRLSTHNHLEASR